MFPVPSASSFPWVLLIYLTVFIGLLGYSIYTYIYVKMVNTKQVNQLSLLVKLMRFLWLKQSNYYNAFQLDSQETGVCVCVFFNERFKFPQ